MIDAHEGSSSMGSRRRCASAPDLTAEEAHVAAWFSALERFDAPSDLRASLLADAVGGRVSEGRVSEGRVSRERPAGRVLRLFPLGFPLGGWGVATAALVLVALGAAMAVELVDPLTPSTGPTPEVSADSLVIVEDPTMALFHDLETFDEVGLARGELIADWHR